MCRRRARTVRAAYRRKTYGESHHRHGLIGTPEYWAWSAMKQRCLNPRKRNWARYGGRGIRVCERWLHSFELFLEDMGPRPSPRHSLDRIDNDGDYEPSNCRWATPGEQRRHQARLVRFRGELLTLAEWSKRTGLNASTIADRLDRGWTVERALTRAANKGLRE